MVVLHTNPRKRAKVTNENQSPNLGEPMHVDRVIIANEDRDVRIRQIGLTLVVILLSLWTAFKF